MLCLCSLNFVSTPPHTHTKLCIQVRPFCTCNASHSASCTCTTLAHSSCGLLWVASSSVAARYRKHFLVQNASHSSSSGGSPWATDTANTTTSVSTVLISCGDHGWLHGIHATTFDCQLLRGCMGRATPGLAAVPCSGLPLHQ